MGKIIFTLGFLARVCLASPDLPTGWDITLELTQLEIGKETFSLYSVKPIDVEAELRHVPPQEMKEALRRLYQRRRDAEEMLDLISKFVIKWSINRKVVDETEFPSLANHLQKIRSGKYPFMAVTRYLNPHTIYQVFGLGLDEGSGIPLEMRLKGKGLPPLPRPERRIDPVPICYVPTRGTPKCDPEISRVLSRIPRRHGDIAEVRSVTKGLDSPYDFTELLFNRAIAEHWFHWGGTLLSEDERPPALTGALLDDVLALKAKHPEISDQLLFPERQERLFIDQYYAHTLRISRVRLWSQKFGTQLFTPPFADVDFPGMSAHVMTLSSAELFQNTPLLLQNSPSHFLVEMGSVIESDIHPFSCTHLVGRDYYQSKKTFRGLGKGWTMLLSSEEFREPPDHSYIKRRWRKFLADEKLLQASS